MELRSFHVLLEWDPDDEVWITHVPVLGHVSTFGETREKALANTKEAILGYLEAAAKEGLPVPAEDTHAELVSVNVQVP